MNMRLNGKSIMQFLARRVCVLPHMFFVLWMCVMCQAWMRLQQIFHYCVYGGNCSGIRVLTSVKV